MYVCKESRVKVNLNNIGLNQNKSVAFKGYTPAKDEKGYKIYEFYYPFDSNKYDCYLEMYEAFTDDAKNYYVGDGSSLGYFDKNNPEAKNPNGKKLEPNKVNKVNLAADFGITDMSKPIAYHYKGINKNDPNNVVYKVDSGIIIDERTKDKPEAVYNILNQNGTNNFRGGSAKLFATDTYKPGVYFDRNGQIKENTEIKNRAKNTIPNITTVMGGTIAGVVKGLDEGDFDNYDYLITLPWFMSATMGGHGYWSENCYQISPNLGNISHYRKFVKKMFAKDKQFITDAAFVNEGLLGVHFQHLLKWEDESYANDWITAGGLKSGHLTAGVFGKNHSFISHKIVNSPIAYKQKMNGNIEKIANPNYDKRKPTYVQIFDTRLVAEREKKDTTKLITTYIKPNTDNPLEINNHNDTVVPYPFMVFDPKVYEKNIDRLNEYNSSQPKDKQIMMDSYLGTRFLTKLGNLYIDEKFEGGFKTWDANPDIAKLNFISSNADTEEAFNLETDEARRAFFRHIERKNSEVQDYILSAAKFWTKQTSQIMNLQVAQHLKTPDASNPGEVYNQILKNIDDGIFPQNLKRKITPEMVENVLNGDYNLKPLSSENFMTQLEFSMMDVPLESIEFGNDVVGVLASPYISKRATSEDDVGKTRSEIYQEHDSTIPDKYRTTYEQTNKLFLQDGAINNFAMDILTSVNQQLGPKRSLMNIYRDTTPYGKYALPYLANEIVKFAVIKSLEPRADVKYDEETGEILYDYDELKKVSLNKLKIKEGGPEEEAVHIINKIKSGVKNINKHDKKILVDGLLKMLEGTNENSFKLAEMIVDRTGNGLNWRIDATKDIADIDALKDHNTDFEYTWDKIIDFWGKFAQGVLEENPNAYMVAEVTDETDLFDQAGGWISKRYSNPNDKFNETNKESIDMKFLRETGVTSLANYSYIFSTISDIFGQNTEDGQSKIDTNPAVIGRKIYDKFIQPGMFNNYLKAMPYESLLFSYNFIGNHDKPRILQCLSMDMRMFYANLNDYSAPDLRERAYRVLENQHDFKEETIRQVSENASKYDFSLYSPKAIAAAEMLRRGLIDGLNSLAAENRPAFTNENHTRIFEIVGATLQDLAKGSYLKKTFENDALGTKEIHWLINIALNQAESEHGLKLSKEDRRDYENRAFDIIIGPAYTKLEGMMQYLNAIVGIPTLYAGDELASTGYETKTKNIYLQNRGYLHNEWADPNSPEKKQFIVEGKQRIDKEMGIRTKYENHALNDGAPIVLKLQYPRGDEESKNCPITAFFRQSSDGAMAVTLLNPTGMTRDPNVPYKPAHLTLDSIGLGKDLGEYHDDVGLNFGIQPGTKFIDARNGDDEYVVREFNNNYFIKRVNKDNPDEPNQDLPIELKDATLVLTHAPSFTGRVNKALVPNRYQQNKEVVTGSKLQLIAG